ncbi:MAG: carboxypeptidase regulatory-like domain-containing protein, partial [Deltaproteobacteria bacterium]|nr:carboxypeptidase regulatory-like domain-containing protein [Deltaproteobacteria bacterium]
LVVLLAACGGATPRTARSTTGAIAGLARDHDSGDPVAKADIRVRGQGDFEPRAATTSDRGLYDVDGLAPGRYQLTARFAGQPVDVVNIDVRAGETMYVDVLFTLGRPEPLRVDYGDKAGAIGRYRPPNLGETVSLIEGTVNDTSTRERVPGAVVTAVSGQGTQQTISDDHGRYRFDLTPPGTYSISAYYNISGRGQIEVRRSQIEVAGAEAVMVPLWIEMGR